MISQAGCSLVQARKRKENTFFLFLLRPAAPEILHQSSLYCMLWCTTCVLAKGRARAWDASADATSSLPPPPTYSPDRPENIPRDQPSRSADSSDNSLLKSNAQATRTTMVNKYLVTLGHIPHARRLYVYQDNQGALLRRIPISLQIVMRLFLEAPSCFRSTLYFVVVTLTPTKPRLTRGQGISPSSRNIQRDECVSFKP